MAPKFKAIQYHSSINFDKNGSDGECVSIEFCAAWIYTLPELVGERVEKFKGMDGVNAPLVPKNVEIVTMVIIRLLNVKMKASWPLNARKT